MPNLILLPLRIVGAVTGPLLLVRTIMELLKKGKKKIIIKLLDSAFL